MHANEFGVLYALVNTRCAIHRASTKEIQLNLRHSFSVLHHIIRNFKYSVERINW
jgi:hypothetical protein